MHILQLSLFFLLIYAAIAQRSTIRNLQARYDAQVDAIFVTWTAPETDRRGKKSIRPISISLILDLQYQIQYRIINRDPPDNDLHYKRVQVTEARLDLPNLQNGDEVEVEV